MIKRQFLVMNEKDVLGVYIELVARKKWKIPPSGGGSAGKGKKPTLVFRKYSLVQ